MVFGRTPRILVAKPGPDGHDRDVKVIARALKDAGFEVVYTGLEQTVHMIVAAAIQEDVDAIGLAGMSAEQVPICRTLVELLKSKGADDIMVLANGEFSSQDITALKDMGIAIVRPGEPDVDSPAAFIREHMLARAESFAEKASRGNL